MNDPELQSAGREPHEFERKLIEALKHTDPPDAFVERVLKRAALRSDTSPQRLRWFPPLPHWAWTSAALAMLVLVAFVANQVRIRHERVQVALAKAEFETAMRITDQALEETRADLEHAGLKFGD